MAITTDVKGENSWVSGPLRSGPMLGEVGFHDAFVWAQAATTAQLTLTLTPPAGPALQFFATPTAAEGLCVVFHATGLQAGVEYDYRLSSGGAQTKTYKLRAGLPTSARRARIAFGSCFQFWDKPVLPIFDAIAGERPDVFVMTGDNSYLPPDWQEDDDLDLAIHLRHRNNDSLRRLVPNVSTLGVWDDHDFGPNDSDSKTLHGDGMGDALANFKRMWAQRSYGTSNPTVEGVFSSVRCGPVEIFLLDDRYHRVERHHILGPDQLSWLSSQLQASPSPVKLVVSGSVVLPGFVTTIQGGSGKDGNGTPRTSCSRCSPTSNSTM